MVPTSALTLLVLSLALVLRVGFAVRSRFLVDGMLAAVLAVATLEIVDLLTGLPLAPDRLFASAAEMSLGRQVGRMFPLVALSLAFLVVALLLSRSTGSRSRSASAALSLMVANFGFVLCVGYAYDTPLLFSTAPLPPAFPASLALMLLGFGVAGLTNDRRPFVFFVGESVRAQLMRALLPVVTVSTIAFAALDVATHRFGLVQSPLTISLVFIATVAVLSAAVLRSASRIGLRIDRSDAALVSSNSALEHMVHDVAKTMGRVVEQRDPYTQGHEQRVAALAVRLARNMGLSDDEVDGIEMAGLLHDVGKLRVPAEILTKPGRLSAAEFALIKEHSQAGYDILEGIAFPWRIADAVLQHHERMDGSGYPHGLAGDAILTAARVLAVADAVEAMAYDRPYRPALGLDAAAKEIATHPELFDPAVARPAVPLCTQRVRLSYRPQACRRERRRALAEPNRWQEAS